MSNVLTQGMQTLGFNTKNYELRTIPMNWHRFVELIRAHQRFLLVSHVRPDCDALGSELGMAGVLEALGKHVRIVNAQKTPPNLQFIDPQRKIKVLGEDIRAEDLADVELLMV